MINKLKYFTSATDTTVDFLNKVADTINQVVDKQESLDRDIKKIKDSIDTINFYTDKMDKKIKEIKEDKEKEK